MNLGEGFLQQKIFKEKSSGEVFKINITGLYIIYIENIMHLQYSLCVTALINI